MFHKPFRVKSNSQMKGSDKKKLKIELKSKYVNLSDEDLDSLLPSKEEVLIQKIYTFSGENVTVYVAKRNPMFFALERDKANVYPTVYASWLVPDLVPTFSTYPTVLDKIRNGADLMLPGVVVDIQKGPSAYGILSKGDVISINLVNNKANVAVGYANLSSQDMYMAGNSGKAVIILHSFGDNLWKSGTQDEIPDLGLPYELSTLSIDDGSDYESKEEEVVGETPEDIRVEPETKHELAPEPETHNDDRSEAEKMADLLRDSFLTSWKKSAKKAELPILTSTFFRVHMVKTAFPQELNVKKSSYKKLSNFLSEMSQYGVIKVKELQKGVESIVEVDLNHELIRSHRVVTASTADVEGEGGNIEEKYVAPRDKPYEPPKIVELFLVSAAVSQFFKPKYCKGHGLTKLQVRNFIKDYVVKEGLQRESELSLDPVLAGIVLNKNENDVVTIKWEDLTNRILKKMSPGYSIQNPGSTSAVIHKGHLDPITMTVANRSGNKKVTLIYNLDLYGIDPNELAHKCQVGVAASATVDMNPANRKAGSEVLIQGNQIAYVTKLLTQEYKIDKKYLAGTEKAVKVKGGKK